MSCTLLAALLVVGAPLPEKEVALPKGPAPYIVLVSVQPDGTPAVPHTILEYVPATETYKVQVGNKEEVRQRTISVPVQKTVSLALDGKDMQVFGADGKKIEPAELRQRIRGPVPALASADGKPVDPFYLKLAREGTLVLVSPALATQPTATLPVAPAPPAPPGERVPQPRPEKP
jgi:hypothetical protein